MIPDHPSPEDAATVRAFLNEAGFTEPVLCARLDLPDIYHFAPVSLGRPALTDTADAVDLLIRLFLDSEVMGAETVGEFVPEEVVTALERLGLVERREDGRLEARVILYPTESLHIVSDRPRRAASAPGDGASDAVYPAVTMGAKHFVTCIPRSPVRRVLDLCSGSGIGALVAAPAAEHAWAVDITERSTRFARFNAVLNEVHNVTALCGDLYEAVEGETFDRIVAHPPYVPSTETRHIYRDGGRDGERITRAVIQGLPEHLEPGGRLFCHCTLADRVGASLEERVREWLGDAGPSFDVLIFTLGTLDPYRALYEEALRGKATVEDVRHREAIYRRMAIQELVYCTLLVQRSEAPRPVMNQRRARGDDTDGAAMEWLLDWETSCLTAGAHPLDGALLSASPHARSMIGRLLKEGSWVTERATLETEWPFPMRLPCAPWLADFVEACDGSATALDHFLRLRNSETLSPEASETEFLKLVGDLVSAGILTVPSSPLPPRPARTTTGG